MQVPPPFGVRALRIGARIEIRRPILVIQIGRAHRAVDMRLTGVAELQLGPLAAIGTGDEQHRPWTGVLAMIGERSGVTSTIPPQLRSIRIRRNCGNSSQIASSVCVAMCRPPRWV
ncbi:hypothetical protein WR25_14766 [Diploscapter pachys]|uniref:Uncharacterized protein n=1 Tax=Diploscapter pachys TaxID=2018661 RepID=A0A2A2K585_9BILA|nr:hypothetical protein WR25_14766 [Diploscapter pachys]